MGAETQKIDYTIDDLESEAFEAFHPLAFRRNRTTAGWPCVEMRFEDNGELTLALMRPMDGRAAVAYTLLFRTGDYDHGVLETAPESMRHLIRKLAMEYRLRGWVK
jgi:hypothetical protein